MQTKFVSTNSNMERNRSFGTYKCEKFSSSLALLARTRTYVDLLSVVCELYFHAVSI